MKKTASCSTGSRCRWTYLWQQDAAFTLLEVMMAVAVVAMSFVALLASQSQSISIASISRFETTSALLARKKLAELEVVGFDSLTSGSGEFESDFSDYHWQVEVSELTEDQTGVVDSSGMLKLVKLTVGRGDDDQESFVVRAVVMAAIAPSEERP